MKRFSCLVLVGAVAACGGAEFQSGSSAPGGGAGALAAGNGVAGASDGGHPSGGSTAAGASGNGDAGVGGAPNGGAGGSIAAGAAGSTSGSAAGAGGSVAGAGGSVAGADQGGGGSIGAGAGGSVIGSAGTSPGGAAGAPTIAYVNADFGVDTNDGVTPHTPVKTLKQGLALGASTLEVCDAMATYASVTIAQDVTIVGGFTCHDFSVEMGVRPHVTDPAPTVVTITAGNVVIDDLEIDGSTTSGFETAAVHVNGSGAALTLKNSVLRGGAGTTSGGGSRGLFVENGALVDVEAFSEIYGGTGTTVVPGTDPNAGSAAVGILVVGSKLTLADSAVVGRTAGFTGNGAATSVSGVLCRTGAHCEIDRARITGGAVATASGLIRGVTARDGSTLTLRDSLVLSGHLTTSEDPPVGNAVAVRVDGVTAATPTTIARNTIVIADGSTSAQDAGTCDGVFVADGAGTTIDGNLFVNGGFNLVNPAIRIQHDASNTNAVASVSDNLFVNFSVLTTTTTTGSSMTNISAASVTEADALFIASGSSPSTTTNVLAVQGCMADPTCAKYKWKDLPTFFQQWADIDGSAAIASFDAYALSNDAGCAAAGRGLPLNQAEKDVFRVDRSVSAPTAAGAQEITQCNQ